MLKRRSTTCLDVRRMVHRLSAPGVLPALCIAAAGAFASPVAGAGGVQQFVIGADELVGLVNSFSPYQSVGLATIEDDLRLVYGTGSNARHRAILMTGSSEQYPPGEFFLGEYRCGAAGR
jgi:hypothetical protein